MSSSEIDRINKAALEYNKSVAPALKSIAEPLFSYAGLTHLSYTKFIPGTRYLTLSLDCNLVEKYLRQNLDRHVFFDILTLPKNSKRVLSWDSQKDNDLLEFMGGNNYAHGLSVFVRHDQLIEAWHFSTDRNNAAINQFYSNEQHLIDKFIISFIEKAGDIVSTDDKQKLAIYHENRSLDFSVFDGQGDGHLQELLQVNKYPFQANGETVYLYQSEFECLQALSEGLSAKLIAYKLGISPRTVESHLMNVKAKLNLYSKIDLLAAFKQSIYSKLLS